VVLEEGPPDQLFTAPVHERTKRFLARIMRPLDADGQGDAGPSSGDAGK
jgi:ABC-type dipeptide/oligopeptide/nickel transport system ATPase component